MRASSAELEAPLSVLHHHSPLFKVPLSSNINIFDLFHPDRIVLITLNVDMPTTGGQGSSRGVGSPTMTRSEGTSQKQAVNHTAPQTDSYPSQEFMKMQHQMMLMQSASYVDPPVGIGWRGTPQTFTPEIDDIIGGRFNQPVASGNFLDPRVCFELSGIGRDDRSAGAVGKSPHQQVPWDVPTPESYARQVGASILSSNYWLANFVKASVHTQKGLRSLRVT
jgi:hypothetical protein